jgi:tight adherence protein C
MRLNARIRSRQAEIRLQLPYYLDLLTLALEAGLDLVAAVEEIVTRDKENALRFELLLTLKSVRMGTTRTKAFSDLAGRTGVEALNLFANSIQQSEELGSSLGGLLRIQAESLRREIFRDAEERAQKAPVKMLLPLIFCLFPVVMLIMFVPLGLRVMGLY